MAFMYKNIEHDFLHIYIYFNIIYQEDHIDDVWPQEGEVIQDISAA